MKSLKIRLNSIDDVNEFVRIANLFHDDIDLISGRYIVDAKSIMGIFSLDLSGPITAMIHGDHADELLKDMEPFIIEYK